MLTIYNVKSTRDFLSLALEDKKRTNPQFSIRSWAQQMGFKSHNSLYQVMKGQRSMPKSFIPRLKESLKMTAKEVRYLETLVDLEKAKDLKEREAYIERLQKMSPEKREDFLELQNFNFFRDPLKAAIAELVLTKGFQEDPAWIQKRLAMKTSLYEIQRAIDCLLEVGIIERTARGKLIRRDVHIGSQNDTKDVALQDFHQRLCSIAAEQITKQELNKREFQGFIFNIEEKKIKEAKERIRDFIREFSKEFEAKEGSKSETYCMQNNLFSLTK